MKAEELRLNNIMMINHGKDRYCRVEWIQKDAVSVQFFERAEDMVNGSIAHPDNLNPIPLTPSLLEACGLKRESGEVYALWIDYRKPELIVYFINENEIYILSGERKILINSLHHFQNVAYFLTGHELTVNFKP